MTKECGMGEMRNIYRSSAEKHHETQPHGRYGEDERKTFKTNFREAEYEDGD
jgi:hypothetical protein